MSRDAVEQDDGGNDHDPAVARAWGGAPSRREATGLGLASLLIAPAALGRLARAQPVAESGQTSQAGFLSRRELALLDELAEIILPSDEHAPGARAAGVAQDIDGWLAALRPRIPEQRATRTGFRRGLRAVDRLSRRLHKKEFLAASPQERLAVVTAMARGESNPRSAAETFFVVLKREVVQSYYQSQVGIHEDIGYRGNSYLDEYVGYHPDEPLVLPDVRKKALEDEAGRDDPQDRW